jgi:hypothetical protein
VAAQRRFHLFVAITVLLFAFAFVGHSAGAQSVTVCPLGQGYWATHPEAWAVNSLMLGTQFYNQTELLALTPGGGGDASTILAVQLIAAKLNIAAGADPAQASTAILQADSLLGQLTGKLPLNVDPSSANGQAMVNIASALNAYNSGLLIPNCAPTPTATATPAPPPLVIVIQGTVQAVNANIITIAGINVQVNADNPILSAIQIGTPLRVEGTAGSDANGQFLIVATMIAAAPADMPTQTIYVQGRVDMVNANVITIAGISIQIDPANPTLISIQPGDYVQINANIHLGGTSVALVATTVVVIVNVVPDAIPTVTPTTTPPTATPTPGLPVTIIVEGPVQVVNVNVITIYDIDVTINANDPVLTQIQVGDFVRIEGDMITQNNTVVVVAVSVFVVEVDVIVSNNNTIIWQDDNGCGNPPPPWAPAHGWRRRCQGGGNNVIIITGDWDDDDDDGMGMGMGDD